MDSKEPIKLQKNSQPLKAINILEIGDFLSALKWLKISNSFNGNPGDATVHQGVKFHIYLLFITLLKVTISMKFK